MYALAFLGAGKGIDQPYAILRGQLQRSRPYEYGPQAVTLLATPLYSNTTSVTGYFA